MMPGRYPIQMPMRASKEGWVYFLQSIDGGPVKIGSSTNLLYRLSRIQECSPTRLRLLAVQSGGMYAEFLYHVELARWRLHGEWFDERAPFLSYLLDRVDSPEPAPAPSEEGA